MASVKTYYTVLARRAVRQAADPLVAQVAGEIRDAAAAASPRRYGNLAAGWRAERAPGQPDAVYFVTNDARNRRGEPYAQWVEYGTRRIRGQAMLGRAMAAARRRYGR